MKSTFVIVVGLFLIGGMPTPKPEDNQAKAEPVVVATPKPPAEEFKAAIEELAPKAHDYGCDTYPVRARGYDRNGAATFPTGSCVSLGKGKFLTAAHIFLNLQAGYVAEVSVDGEWHKAVTFAADIKNDTAELTIAKTDIEGVPTRKVQFGEKVTIYGLTTCEAMHGIYAGDKHVGLDQGTNGIDYGDSGGGVYGEDGALVGLISGFGDDRRSVFVSLVVQKPKEVAQAAAPLPAAEPKAVAQPVQSCPNGQCQRVQVQQFQGRFKKWK